MREHYLEQNKLSILKTHCLTTCVINVMYYVCDNARTLKCELYYINGWLTYKNICNVNII